MTVSIFVSGSTFTNYTRRVRLPYATDAASYYLYGTDFAASSVNHAVNAEGTMTAVATPTYGTGYATVSQTNGFDLGYINTRPYTQIVVSTYAGADSGLIGHWTGSYKDLLGFSSGNLIVAVDSNIRATRNSPPTSGYSFYAATYSGTSAIAYAHNGTSMISTSGAFVSANTPDANLRVGASGFGSGNFNVAASVAFESELTLSQLGEIYAYLKEFLATRSITVN